MFDSLSYTEQENMLKKLAPIQIIAILSFKALPTLKKHVVFLVMDVSILSCKQKVECDLIIKNATILDAETGDLVQNSSIVIDKGKIKDILIDSKEYRAEQTIVADGKLITQSFVDTHIHPTDVLEIGKMHLFH